MKMSHLLLGLALMAPMAAAAQGTGEPPASDPPMIEHPDFLGLTYICDRDVEVPVVYVRSDKGGLVVLTVEGMQLTLLEEVAASGVRFGWPSDGASYIWWTKGETASLYWREDGKETTVYESCKAME